MLKQAREQAQKKGKYLILTPVLASLLVQGCFRSERRALGLALVSALVFASLAQLGRFRDCQL